ncbi:hypothetical protein SARC_02868 [Sphaeroforma arctica JP610]|uniref:Protein kinase domain-containing protein n=1 Tax=Sphaeroforma arctica JP610 TaxID=667725 RepID=A0A0L0G7L6_9EUKA|nr:hypothetical protein SARC_02868 [Sphaeroforma arctica JP610]KNC84914.1 hypothetical protein SARC_02868 [Sphaeroforma arctica JP610]|eukprot:XP_014158816.1 hypothetical protein SARC_02868 [Sphaeroforma arctica JP610]
MKRVQHENVVSMDDAFLQKRKITMAIEYCAGGSVLDIREVDSSLMFNRATTTDYASPRAFYIHALTIPHTSSVLR